MEPDTTPDEAERAFMTARYDVSNEQLAERTAAAPDMGGSLLTGLNAFMQQKITANSLQAWRQWATFTCKMPGSRNSPREAGQMLFLMRAICMPGASWVKNQSSTRTQTGQYSSWLLQHWAGMTACCAPPASMFMHEITRCVMQASSMH